MMWFDGGDIRGKLESCMMNMVCLSGSFFVWMGEEGRGGILIFFVWYFWLTLYEQAPLCESIHSKYTSTIRIIIITSTRVLPNVERNGLGQLLCLGHLLRISLLYRMNCIVDDAHR